MAPTQTGTVISIAPAISWLKTHERIIIVALCLGLGAFGLTKFYDVEAARKDAKYVAAQQAVIEAQKNSAALALQAAQTQAQYVALVSELTTQNASLASAIAARQKSQIAQQAADARLPITDLATRLQTLGNAPAGSVSVTSGGVDLTQQGALAVTQTLEQVPVLQSDLSDETSIAQNRQQEVDKADLLVNDLNAQITGLHSQVSSQVKECTLQVAAVKAESRKNSMKWFRRGAVVGFIAGLWVGHGL